MKFLKILTFLLSGLSMTASMFAQQVGELRAVKLTNVDSDLLFSDKSIAEGMDYLASIGINTVLTVVWNSSGANGDYTLYPSDVMNNYFGATIHPAFNNRDPLERVLIEAHRNGIEVLPWFEMGFSTSYSQNGGHILNKYPEWALKNSSGNLVVKNGFDWMSAINPEVREFILSLTVEVAQKYDIDGIEYSDRIPAMPVEGGYDDGTVNVYKSEHNGGGPPANYSDADWMQWRADKLSEFFRDVRDTIKAIDENLFVSSSPSLYPWSYENYLQDSKTWLESGIADDIIPQVYRYSFADYSYELDKSLANFPNYLDIYFPGMLMKVGNYLITPEDLLSAISLNRQKDLHGEVFFFYEGLRENQNALGDTLRATFYAEDAQVPGRNGNNWRPKATIVNENDPGIVLSGDWKNSSISGFKGGILINESLNPASVEYYFDVPFSAWFDVYTFCVSGPLTADAAYFSVCSDSDSFSVQFDQTDLYHEGWQYLHSVYLSQGQKKVLVLDNRNLSAGQKLTADAAMIMINRKKSPDVTISLVRPFDEHLHELPQSIVLHQNYPNPFNPVTTIHYSVNKNHNSATKIELSVFNILGQKVTTLFTGKKSAGNYKIEWNAAGLPSGLYYVVIKSGMNQSIVKALLVK